MANRREKKAKKAKKSEGWLKKAERSYSLGNVLRVYSSVDNYPEIFVRKEIYAPKLFIVRVRTVLLWRRERDSPPYTYKKGHFI